MLAIFTNDDAGASRAPEAPEQFRTVVKWLDSLGLHGTFFWVPEPPQWQQAHEVWRETLEWAQGRGHDFQLHGLSHDSCLEFGLPQPSTRRANPTPFEEYERNLEHWQREHQPGRLQDKLERGLAHYERTFGGRPGVFRAPCFGVCPAMYEALHAVGISVSSSRGINPTATAWALEAEHSGAGAGTPPAPVGARLIAPGGLDESSPYASLWQPDFPCTSWIEPPGVREIPCMEDLLLGGVTAEQAPARLELMLSEFEHCLAELGEDGVLVCGAHYGPMARSWEHTRPLLEALLEWLARQGVTEWLTFEQYVTILASAEPSDSASC